jgi:hypothetical protein
MHSGKQVIQKDLMNRRTIVVTVMIRYHIPFAQPFFGSNISNGRRINIIYSHDKIKAPLERKYDPKEEAMRNIGGTVASVKIWHTYLEPHYFSVENLQTTRTSRLWPSSRMTQYRYH